MLVFINVVPSQQRLIIINQECVHITIVEIIIAYLQKRIVKRFSHFGVEH